MKNNLLKLFVILTAVVFCSSLYAQDAYKLQYKFEKGKTYLYRIEATTDISQEMMGQEMKFNTISNNVARFNIENTANDGSADIIFSLDSAYVKSNIRGKDTTFNLQDMIGKKIKMNVSELGRINTYTVLDSMQDNNRTLSVAQESKNFFRLLNGKETKAGDKWNSTEVDTINNMGGKIVSNIDYEYSLAGIEDKLGHQCYKIPFTAKIKIEGKGNMSGMDLFIEGNGKSSGTAYLDVKTGMNVYVESSVDNEMTIATSGQQTMTIPMSQSTKNVISLIGD